MQGIGLTDEDVRDLQTSAEAMQTFRSSKGSSGASGKAGSSASKAGSAVRDEWMQGMGGAHR